MKKRVSDAIAQLRKVNEAAIRDAGPRYTPGLDPGAPNIQIGYLVDAFDALSLVEGWRVRAHGLAERISKACEHQARLLDRAFRRRKATPATLVDQLQALQRLRDPTALRRAALQVRRTAEYVINRLHQETDALWDQLRGLTDEQANREQRARLQSDMRAVGDVTDAVERLVGYFDGPSGRFLRGENALLLLGSWGTGKTHLLCDIARQRIALGAPALLVMASSLPSNADLLDGIATSTGLAASGAELLHELDRLGTSTNSRALLMIDAINEGNQDALAQAASEPGQNRQPASESRTCRELPSAVRRGDRDGTGNEVACVTRALRLSGSRVRRPTRVLLLLQPDGAERATHHAGVHAATLSEDSLRGPQAPRPSSPATEAARDCFGPEGDDVRARVLHKEGRQRDRARSRPCIRWLLACPQGRPQLVQVSPGGWQPAEPIGSATRTRSPVCK